MKQNETIAVYGINGETMSQCGTRGGVKNGYTPQESVLVRNDVKIGQRILFIPPATTKTT